MPAAPVPVIAEARPSLIGRIMGWFKADNLQEPPAAVPTKRAAATKTTTESDAGSRTQPQRGERRPRRDRPERQEKPQRQERPDRHEPRQRPIESGEGRDNERGRSNRQQRPPRRQEEPESQPAVAIIAEPVKDSVPKAAGEGRNKRGRRGGRRDRGEHPHGEGLSAQENLPFATADENVDAAPPPMTERPQPRREAAPATPRMVEPAVNPTPQPQAIPIEASRDSAAAPEPALTAIAPWPQPVTEPATAAVNGGGAPNYVESEEESQRPRNPRRRRQFGGRHERPAPSELVIVETNPDRLPEAEPAVEIAMNMPRRERPSRRPRQDSQAAEPLVQVETQKADG